MKFTQGNKFSTQMRTYLEYNVFSEMRISSLSPINTPDKATAQTSKLSAAWDHIRANSGHNHAKYYSASTFSIYYTIFYYINLYNHQTHR